ncbi:FAD-dependent oxidoreductase [Arthrobacter sp. NPDC090010]|uniref:FAD-dependent oxidoreductase n=1 Tax=Arthrobacter sp. NPDC090010 TaxID=3363942 RepID=UPI0037F603D6
MDGKPYDAVIVGGGPAGLGAAIALARSLRSVLVVDAGQPRNAPAEGAHNVLGHEGISPLKLLEEGRREALAYGVRFLSGEATTAAHDDGAFSIGVVVQDGEPAVVVRSRRLVLATGLVDVLPDVDGLHRGWGHSMLHCPYCHGWEVRGQRIGILASDARAVHQALLFGQLSDAVTVLPGWTDQASGAPGVSWAPGDEAELLEAAGVGLAGSPVTRFEFAGQELSAAVLQDGTRLELDALAVAPVFAARTGLYEQLGGEAVEHPMGVMIPSDPMGKTEVPGVWVAGNAQNLAAMVSVASGSGVQAGAGVNAELAMHDARARIATPKPAPAGLS